MKKISRLLFILVCTTMLISCRKNEDHMEAVVTSSQEAFPITVEVKTVTDREIEIIISNQSPNTVIYGESYGLERYDGAWLPVDPLAENAGFADISYEVEPYGEVSWSTNQSVLYGTLLNGKYRILKDFLIDGAGPESVAGNFIISDHEPVDADIEACIRKKVESFEEECELINVWFDREKSDAEINSYLRSGGGSQNGVKRENICVLFSNLKTGENTWSFEPNTIYNDWKWVLIRDNEDSEWVVDDYGG